MSEITIDVSQTVKEAIDAGNTPAEGADQVRTMLTAADISGLKSSNAQAMINVMQSYYNFWGHPEWHAFFQSNLTWLDQWLAAL